MKLVLTDEQEMIRTAARDFVAGKSSLRRVRALREAGGFSRELWREMGQLGWLGLTLPEEHGGAGLGHVAQMLVLEELGRGLCPEPFLSTVLLGQPLLLLGGNDAQRREHLAASARGERLLALASDEAGSRFELDRVAAKATRSGDGWLLRGVKTHVPGGASADAFIVSASTGDGVELFLVPGDAIGVEREPEMRLDGRDAAELRLSGVSLPAGARLDGGLALLRRVVDRATIGLSAEMLGAASAAFQMTLDYLKTRVQFGVPIGSFQALQHRAAKIFVELELARSAVWRAHALLDENEPALCGDDAVARAASVAKAKVSEAFMLVGYEGIQMHGGIGMTEEHDIGLFLKRARVAEMTFGDATFHRDRFARLSGF